MFNKLKAFSLVEVMAVILILFSIYMYTNKSTSKSDPYIATAQASFSKLLELSNSIIASGGFANRFESENDVINYLVKSSKPLKYCYDAKSEGCWSNNWLWKSKTKPALQLPTMQYITVDFISKNCSYNNNIPNTCAFLYVDTNGPDGPNDIGKDILLFYMTAQGFIPAGTNDDTVTTASACDIENGLYNWGCTAKLLGVH